MEPMDLIERWEAHANEWIAWARTAGHDSYWRFHRDQFLEIVPPPERRTVDIGCGEGRLMRHLKKLGHDIVGVDASRSLVAAARELDPSMDIRLADAAALPLDDASADLVIAFMSLQDVEAMSAAVREVARVLEPGGRFCLAVVHPINSAGRFETDAADAPFVIKSDYLSAFTYADMVERDGLSTTFHSQHRPIESYFWRLKGQACSSKLSENQAFQIVLSTRIVVAVGSGSLYSCTCEPAAHRHPPLVRNGSQAALRFGRAARQLHLHQQTFARTTSRRTRADAADVGSLSVFEKFRGSRVAGSEFQTGMSQAPGT
jgi:SAM-dependent methyltransferase